MKSKIGWGLTLLLALFFAFSASGKFMAANEETLKAFEHIGLSADSKLHLGVIEILSTLLFVIPQTAIFGTILLTGYMGGAIFAHFRIGDPFVVQAIVPVLVWVALGLRRYPEMIALIKK